MSIYDGIRKLKDAVEDGLEEVADGAKGLSDYLSGALGAGANLIEDALRKLGEYGSIVSRFFGTIGRTVVAEAGALAFVAGVATVKSRNAGKPRVALPAEWKDKLRPDFGALVDEVRVVFQASLLDHLTLSLPGKDLQVELRHGIDGQAFGTTIYVAGAFNATSDDQLVLVGHEMVHSRQWVALGRSDHRFGREYFKQWYDAGFSYHGNVMEREAYAFGSCLEIRLAHGGPVAPVQVGDLSTPPGWTAAFAVPLNGRRGVGFYSGLTGQVSIHALGVTGSPALTPIWAGTWPRGLSVIAPYAHPVTVGFILYHGASGQTEFGVLPASPSAPWSPLGTEAWSTGWTIIAPFHLAGRPHYLKYKEDSGSVQVERLKADGSGREDVWEDKWSRGWTSIVPFTSGGVQNFLLYKGEKKGEVKIGAVDASGHWLSARELDWSRGWTHMVADGEYLLAYKHPAGKCASYRRGEYRIIEPHGRTSTAGAVNHWCGRYTAPWNTVGMFMEGGFAYLWRARQTDGKLRVDRIQGF